jgi:hypothetical protein
LLAITVARGDLVARVEATGAGGADDVQGARP